MENNDEDVAIIMSCKSIEDLIGSSSRLKNLHIAAALGQVHFKCSVCVEYLLQHPEKLKASMQNSICQGWIKDREFLKNRKNFSNVKFRLKNHFLGLLSDFD